MAEAAQIVEGMGADIVDVNMGCPVPKIAKHNAGCSLMREPAHAASGDRRDDQGGEDSGDGEDARRLERRRAQRAGAGAAGPGRRRRGGDHPRAHGGAVVHAAWPTGIWWRRSPSSLTIPVLGSGDCVEPEQIVAADAQRRERRAGRPRRAAQPVDPGAGGGSRRRPRAARRDARGARAVPARLHRPAAATNAWTRPQGFRHIAPGEAAAPAAGAGARARALGHQQAAGALRLVLEGPRRRLALPRRA